MDCAAFPEDSIDEQPESLQEFIIKCLLCLVFGVLFVIWIVTTFAPPREIECFAGTLDDGRAYFLHVYDDGSLSLVHNPSDFPLTEFYIMDKGGDGEVGNDPGDECSFLLESGEKDRTGRHILAYSKFSQAEKDHATARFKESTALLLQALADHPVEIKQRE